MKPFTLLALLCLTSCATANARDSAVAANQKHRAPASDAIPKCWKAYNPKLHDGLYHVTIPANDALTARDVQKLIMTLQAFGVASHDVSAYASESIILEAQFVTLDQAKNLGYGTQDKLEELVAFVLKDAVPYLDKGVTITCFEEHPLRHH